MDLSTSFSPLFRACAPFLLLSLAVACGVPDADSDGHLAGEGDCDDESASVYPGADEVPYDGIDQDCDGEDLVDVDSDGAASIDVAGGTDCDDADPEVHPAAVEIWYDDIDQDCDGLSDFDRDLDGFDSDEHGGSDCDDLDPEVNLASDERWYDGVDQDCDGLSDFDQDLDGFDSEEEIDGGQDCDDHDATVNPSVDEIWYDGVDQDCDGANDFDQDADGESAVGWGGGDCDDLDASVHSDAAEIWYDGVDQDCDEGSDFDADGDGFDSETHGGMDCDDGDSTVHPGAVDDPYDGRITDCDNANEFDADADGYQASGFGGDDCDDANSGVYPGASELWYDGIDQDCDGGSDFDQDGDGEASSEYGGTDCDDQDASVGVSVAETWYDGIDQDCDGNDSDQDGDGYDAELMGGEDCDDEDGAVHPGAPEVPYDGIDQDCDGEDLTDFDSDGYDAEQMGGLDCDDVDATVNPGADETCNGLDDDCDGVSDEDDAVDAPTWYDDGDGDGFGDPSSPSRACSAPMATVADASDCDDSAAGTYPGATEICDGYDNDCDSTADEVNLAFGPAGGSASSTCGLELTAAADVASDTVVVHVALEDLSADVVTDDEEIYVVALSGTLSDSLEQPIVVRIPEAASGWSPGELLHVRQYDTITGELSAAALETGDEGDEPVPAYVDDDGALWLAVDHFSTYVVTASVEELFLQAYTIKTVNEDGDLLGLTGDDIHIYLASGQPWSATTWYQPDGTWLGNPSYRQERYEEVLQELIFRTDLTYVGDFEQRASFMLGILEGYGWSDGLALGDEEVSDALEWLDHLYGAGILAAKAAGIGWVLDGFLDAQEITGTALTCSAPITSNIMMHRDYAAVVEERVDAIQTRIDEATLAGENIALDSAFIAAWSDASDAGLAYTGDLEDTIVDDMLPGSECLESAAPLFLEIFLESTYGAAATSWVTFAMTWAVDSYLSDIVGYRKDQARQALALTLAYQLYGDVNPDDLAPSDIDAGTDPGRLEDILAHIWLQRTLWHYRYQDYVNYDDSLLQRILTSVLDDIVEVFWGFEPSEHLATHASNQRSLLDAWYEDYAEQLTFYACDPDVDVPCFYDGDYDGWPAGDDIDEDCDDEDPAVNPSATEEANLVDDDCNGLVDDATDAYDDDGDGVTENEGDCDDEDAAVAPGAMEVCDDDDVDEDCDGLADDDDPDVDAASLLSWYADSDGDGYGDPTVMVETCERPSGHVGDDTDCDDGLAEISPSAPEDCSNTVDDDCDGDLDCDDPSCASDSACVDWSVSIEESEAVLVGEDGGDWAGSAVASLGDTDGDGFDDILVGAPLHSSDGFPSYLMVAPTMGAGSVYLVRGPVTGTTSLSTAAAKIECGGGCDSFGAALSGDLDLNGDGTVDPVIGATYGEGGSVFGYYGPVSGSLLHSDADTILVGENSGDQAGVSLAGVGDVDGDNYDDLLVGAPWQDAGGDKLGAAYLVFGPQSGVISLADADVILTGENDDDEAGSVVAAAGDLDADGLADIAIAAPGSDRGGTDAGAVYLLMGPTTGDGGLGLADAIISGEADNDASGASIASADDLDGDGYDDLLVGAPGSDLAAPDAGAVYLLSGPISGVGSLADAAATLLGEAEDDALGQVSTAGDMDGDGTPDLLLGAAFADGEELDCGAAYLLLGPVSGVASVDESATRWMGSEAGGYLGHSLSPGGDLDGDGNADLLIGSPSYTGSVGAVAGAVYIVLGGQW